MNQDPMQQVPAAPVAPQVPGPAYIGQSNVIDRSAVQSIYPTVGYQPTPSASTSSTPDFSEATSAFSEAIVLVLGLASSSSYILILFYVKNTWATVIISLILAAGAVFSAVKDYRRTKRMTPLTVIGLSAATITLVYLLNLLVTLSVLHSITASY